MEQHSPSAHSVAILKGGVGKSTIAVNLTERLAARGHEVLFVDLDPNGHATKGLGLRDAYNSDDHLGDVLLDDTELSDVIQPTDYGFDVLPSNDALERVEQDIKHGNVLNPYTRFKKKVVEPLLGEQYDHIITDSPAYRGLLSDMALVGTGSIIIPLIATSEAYAGFEQTVEKQVSELHREIGLDITAIVPNDFDSSNRNEHELIEDLNDDFADKLPPFASLDMLETSPGPGIRHRIAFSRAYDAGQPLAYYDPDNDQLERLDQIAAMIEQDGDA